MFICGSGQAREAGTAVRGTGFAGVRGRARSHRIPLGLRHIDASFIAIKRACRYSDGPFFVASLTNHDSLRTLSSRSETSRLLP